MKKTAKPMFDDTIKHEFKFNVRLGPGKIETIEFSVNPPSKDEGHLTYDHVEFAAIDEMDVKYPHDYYPKCEIDGFILIKNDDGEWSPIVSEGDKDGIKKLRKSNEYDRFLILPDATYSLTPELRLYMGLSELGLIDANVTGFDYCKMHELLLKMDGNSENDGKRQD